MAGDIVVVSNRGPLSFTREDDGSLKATRGAGGLVSSLGPLVEGTGATWVAAAISDEDREAAREDLVEAEGFRLKMLAVDPEDYRRAYDVVSNATLWFLHHALWDLPRVPRFDRDWWEAWDAYRRVNLAFAQTVVDLAPEGAIVLLQDYHLALAGTHLTRERDDLRTVHFHHTPFCGPNSIRILPQEAADELLCGLACHAACGFNASRWARAFEASCQEVLGWAPRTFVSPLAPDYDDIAKVATSEVCQREGSRLDTMIGNRRVIARVDRIELSKNLVGGFLAFDDLLKRRPDFREQVVFVALCYPSREGVSEYQAYRQEVQDLVDRINDDWRRPGWTPVIYEATDNFPGSVAVLKRYDVLLVNPIRDGLNLVAKEGPMLNENDGVLVLSREAGAWEEMASAALTVNPFDVAGTADALAAALDLPKGERAGRAATLRDVAAKRTPRRWLDDQLRAAQANKE